MCSAVGVMVYLDSSMHAFFDKADPPHFMQMHAGEIDRAALMDFAARSGMVDQQQIVTLLNINASHLQINPNGEAEIDGVMDNAFVVQNESFDYLLNLDNEIVKLEPGNVAVPLYYLQKYALKVGDSITLSNGRFSMSLRISDFVRDAQMNASIVSSKRFLLNLDDFNILKKHLGEPEFIIEYKLLDINKTGAFETLYQSAGMPQNGPAITYPLLKTLNAISDGLTILVIMLASLLVILMSLICLRFTILSAIEEDMRDIGVLKAIGMNHQEISRLYKLKYKAIILSACLLGYFISLWATGVLTENLSLYMGVAPKNGWHYLLPLIAAAVVFCIAFGFCAAILKKIAKTSPVEAFHGRHFVKGKKRPYMLCLSNNKYMETHVFLGIKCVCERLGQYGLLCAIFAISTFLLIVPFNLLNTVQSNRFIQYMGVVESHIRIDLRQGHDIENRFKQIMAVLKQDDAVDKYAGYVTTRSRIGSSDQKMENLLVESGDFSAFSMRYSEGRAPVADHEIALSLLAAESLGKKTGDTLILEAEGSLHVLTVSGLYQDITNGGKTAKSRRLFDPQNVLWYVIAVNLKNNADTSLISLKSADYARIFHDARVTGIEQYVSQTLGNTIGQLKKLVWGLVAVILVITVFTTLLFLKLILAKESAQIAIQKRLGVPPQKIQNQYVAQLSLLLFAGFMGGLLASLTLGPRVVGLLMSGMGAAHLELTISPLTTFLFVPLSMAMVAGIVTTICFKTIKNQCVKPH